MKIPENIYRMEHCISSGNIRSVTSYQHPVSVHFRRSLRRCIVLCLLLFHVLLVFPDVAGYLVCSTRWIVFMRKNCFSNIINMPVLVTRAVRIIYFFIILLYLLTIILFYHHVLRFCLWNFSTIYYYWYKNLQQKKKPNKETASFPTSHFVT